MKKFFLFFWVIFIISNSIYAEKGICLDDNVRVRSKPTLTDSSVVGKLNKNEIFEIYGYEGSGEYNDGFLDFWVSISSDNNKWVNAYWISTLPLTFNEVDYEGFEYNWKLTDYDKSQDKYELEEMPSSRTIKIDKKYLGFTLNDARRSFLLNCIEKWPCIKSIIPKADPETDYDKKRINLGQNSFAVFLQYDQYVFLSSFEINEPSVKILYGIHVGMEKELLESILGSLKKDSNGNFYYSNELVGSEKYLYFKFENDRISKIMFKLDI